MKTTEAANKYEKFTGVRGERVGRNRAEDFQEFNNDLNEERIISSYRPKERIFYYDNSQISMSYGQYNVEKCLIVLFIIIVTQACLIYNYYLILSYTSLTLLLSGTGVDLITSFLYLYFLIKLKSDQIFNKIPNSITNSSDILILLNLILKIVTLVFIYIEMNVLGVTAVVLFSLKFLIEFYFAVISVKIFMFCPCTLYLQEQTGKLWNWIKYYVFCCEVEEQQENPDYTKLEDLESFY
jgi:hypothetical protein